MISAQCLYGALIVLYYFVYSISTFAGLQQQAVELRINLQSVGFFFFFSPLYEQIFIPLWVCPVLLELPLKWTLVQLVG